MKKTNDKKKTPRFAKILLTVLIVCICLAALGAAALMIADKAVLGAAKGKIYEHESTGFPGFGEYDCILILGAGVRDDGTPSPMLNDRLLSGISLYESGAAGKIIVSGDHGGVGYDEVNTMKSFAVAHGVPSSDVFMDHAGFSTYESLYRAKAVFGVKKLIIVTQAYHLPLALYIAEKMGLDAVGVDADFRAYRGQSYRDARELLARAKDVLSSYFMPLPKYLGETIDVFGDGDITNDN